MGEVPVGPTGVLTVVAGAVPLLIDVGGGMTVVAGQLVTVIVTVSPATVVGGGGGGGLITVVLLGGTEVMVDTGGGVLVGTEVVLVGAKVELAVTTGVQRLAGRVKVPARFPEPP